MTRVYTARKIFEWYWIHSVTGETDEQAFPTTSKKASLNWSWTILFLYWPEASESEMLQKRLTQTQGVPQPFPHPPSARTPHSPALPQEQGHGVQVNHFSRTRCHLLELTTGTVLRQFSPAALPPGSQPAIPHLQLHELPSPSAHPTHSSSVLVNRKQHTGHLSAGPTPQHLGCFPAGFQFPDGTDSPHEQRFGCASPSPGPCSKQET